MTHAPEPHPAHDTPPALLANPLRPLLAAADASFMTYADRIELVETFGHYEAEYAVIRKGVGLLDMAHQGVIRLTGADRADFLHRFVTNEVRAVQPGDSRRAFLLTRTGRIMADLRIVAGDDHHLLLLDRTDAQAVTAHLDQFLFAEDVTLTDVSADRHVLALHGPQAAMLLSALGGQGIEAMQPGQSAAVTLAGQPATVVRLDETGSPGFQVILDAAHALAVAQAVIDVFGGLSPEVEGGVRRSFTGRGIGWMAYNTARIEAGSAVYHVDFGPDSLAHEVNAIDQTVSFTKGCYLGQEIVARMHNLGHPKKLLVSLAFEDDRLPLAGAQVFDSADGATIIGAVTSSCLSPLAGNQAIALAMMKWNKHTEGTSVIVSAEGAQVPATVKTLKLL